MVNLVRTVEFDHILRAALGGVRVGEGPGGSPCDGEGAATMFRDGDFFFNYENSIILPSIVGSFFPIFSIFF